jgi:hypothetical protein
MSDDGDEIALATSFDAQHAEAILGIMEGDTVDQPGQDLRRAHRGCSLHAAMMEIKFQDRYCDQPGR